MCKECNLAVLLDNQKHVSLMYSENEAAKEFDKNLFMFVGE